MGVGECVSDSVSFPSLTLCAGEMADRPRVRQKLFDILELKRAHCQALLEFATPQEVEVFNEPSWIDVAAELYSDISERLTIVSAPRSMEMIASSSCLVMEGAQGVLLDESAGFAPHTTWSVTTYQNADALLEELGVDTERFRIGVMRTYMTRHGTGPLVTEDERLNARLPEPHNTDDGWPGRFRRGIFDFVMFRYAIAACGGVDSLAVTCLDRLPQLPPLVCEEYLLDRADAFPICKPGEVDSATLSRAIPKYAVFRTDSAEACLEAIASGLEVDVGICSFGPTRFDKKNLQGIR
jgi:adenylosuccinate synthase